MTKIYFLFFIFFFIDLPAQKQILLEGRISQTDYYEKIPLIEDHGLLFVEVEINAKKYKFLFDTGAPNLLNEDVFENLVLSTSINTFDSNNQQKRLSVTKVNQFYLGKLAFNQFNFVLSNFQKIKILNCLNVDGIIGSNSFKDSVIKIDYTNKFLIITNSVKKLSPKVKAENLKLTSADKKPYLPIQLSSHAKSINQFMLLDTGFRGLLLETLSASQGLLKNKIAENSFIRKGRNSVGLQGLENFHEKIFYTLPAIKLGNTSIHNIHTSSSLDTEPKLGVEILRYGNIVLDFNKEKYYFESPQQDFIIEKKEQLYNTYEFNNKLFIGFVIHPQLQKLLFSGDEIIKIDQQEIGELDCQTMLNIKPAEKSITIKRDDKEFIVDVKNLN